VSLSFAISKKAAVLWTIGDAKKKNGVGKIFSSVDARFAGG